MLSLYVWDEIIYFGRPFRAGPGVAAPRAKARLKPWAVLCFPSGGKSAACSLNTHGQLPEVGSSRFSEYRAPCTRMALKNWVYAYGLEAYAVPGR